ncbi:MAG: hypothetical protein U0R18_15170 [Mycobacterium sp.]
MSSRSTRVATLSTAVLLTLSLAGCAATGDDTRHTGTTGAGTTGPTGAATSPASPFQPTTTTEASSIDFGPLLLQAGDVSDDQDTFTVASTKPDLNGHPGASALFVNADETRAISVTLAGFPNAAAASAARQQTLDTANTVVTGGAPAPLGVGTDGTVIRGNAPDSSKAVTLVLFTHGPVLARLEFDSATGDPTTDRFVTDVAKMQQIALRVGMPDSGS